MEHAADRPGQYVDITQKSWTIMQQNQQIQTLANEIYNLQTYTKAEEHTPGWSERLRQTTVIDQAVVTIEIEHKLAGPTIGMKKVITQTPIYLSCFLIPSHDGVGDIGRFSIGNDINELSQNDPSGLTKKITLTALPVDGIDFKCIDVTYVWEEDFMGGEFLEEGNIYFYSNGSVVGNGAVGEKFAELLIPIIGSYNSRISESSATDTIEDISSPASSPLPQESSLATAYSPLQPELPEDTLATNYPMAVRAKENFTWLRKKVLHSPVDLRILMGTRSYDDQLTVPELVNKLREHHAPTRRLDDLGAALTLSLEKKLREDKRARKAKVSQPPTAEKPLILVSLNAPSLDMNNKKILDDLRQGQSFRYIQALDCVRVLQGDDARSLLSAFLRWMHEVIGEGDGDDLGTGIYIRQGIIRLTDPIRGFRQEFFTAMERIGYSAVAA